MNARHYAKLGEFTTDIRYVKGETNFVADALLRPSVSVIGSDSSVDYKKFSEDQALDTEFTRLRHSTSSTLNFQLLKLADNILIWCDLSTGHARPYITDKFRKKVFMSLHRLGHPLHRATKPLINSRFVWHGMNIDVRQLVPQLKSFGKFNEPKERFDHAHVDTVGYLPYSD